MALEAKGTKQGYQAYLPLFMMLNFYNAQSLSGLIPSSGGGNGQVATQTRHYPLLSKFCTTITLALVSHQTGFHQHRAIERRRI